MGPLGIEFTIERIDIQVALVDFFYDPISISINIKTTLSA